MQLSYDDALALLRQHNQNQSLVRHGIAVGAACEAYARKYGEDPLTFRIAGLLHDVDYEEHPTIEEHGRVGSEWLRALGYPEAIVHSTLAHNDSLGVPRDDRLSQVVFACDELAGLVTAAALVRPNKSIHGLEAASVRKKMKDKAFARGVNRDDIVKGADELGVELGDHIAFVIAAMATVAGELGLEGTGA